MNYFKDYKNERYHDGLLISLVKYLSKHELLNLFSKHFLQGAIVFKLIDAKTRRDFDVLIEFDNCVCCLESKVDSCENWYENEKKYQTDKIYSKYSQGNFGGKNMFFFFTTYGTSEFYIKKTETGEYKSGPFSKHFRHFKLDDTIKFLTEALKAVKDNGASEIEAYHEWLAVLTMESEKRKNYKYFLKCIDSFREKYLKIIKLTDFPVNRVNIGIPEFLFIFYKDIADKWNKVEGNGNFGRTLLYPVGRNARINDCILNFQELWCNCDLTCGGIIPSGKKLLYFEMNEDFNLHLKVSDDKIFKDGIDNISAFINERALELKVDGINSIKECYKQGSYVVYEWDLDILSHLDDVDPIVDKLKKILSKAVSVLK